MSLMGTLAKVAIGIVVAKSVGGMLKNGMPGMPGGSGATVGTDGRYGSDYSPGRKTTGLEGMMKDVLQGTPAGDGGPAGPRAGTDPFGNPSDPVVIGQPGASGGGLGDLLKQLGGSAAGAGGMQGGLGQILSQLGGGAGGGAGGGLGGLLGGLLAGAAGTAAGGAATNSTGGKGFGDMLNEAFGNGGEPSAPPAPEHEAAAGLMLKAMIQAAKSDGRIDAVEQKKLTDTLADASPDEMQFVRQELQAPVDIPGLCAQVPQGMGSQVYGMSLMAIDFDNRTEAEYLMRLAAGLGLSSQDVAQIHTQLGAPALTE